MGFASLIDGWGVCAVSRRFCTMGLLTVLSHLYRPQYFAFVLLQVLDIVSHWIQMYRCGTHTHVLLHALLHAQRTPLPHLQPDAVACDPLCFPSPPPLFSLPLRCPRLISQLSAAWLWVPQDLCQRQERQLPAAILLLLPLRPVHLGGHQRGLPGGPLPPQVHVSTVPDQSINQSINGSSAG